MKLKIADLNSTSSRSAVTEIMYEIASARVIGAELLRININKNGNESAYKKLLNTALKTLKTMKAERKIQFFASESSFEDMSMEASFLLNKYPDLFDPMPQADEVCGFVYVKL